MAKQLTQQEFLEKALPLCKGRVGLNEFVYTKSNQKSSATCLVNVAHKPFYISPNKLLGMGGCPECAGNKAKSLEAVYDEIKHVHGDKYILTENSEYINTNTKIELFCTTCNEPFLISPKKCKSGQGHSRCSREEASHKRAYSLQELLEASETIFGKGVFLYDLDTFINLTSPMVIGCRVHGDFVATPINHFNTKYGCPQCWDLARGRETTRKFEDDFESLAREVHGDAYDYSQFTYVDYKTKGTILCKKHGPFSMTPDVHICSGCGCLKCSHTFSRAQEDFTKFIESLGIVVERNYSLPSKQQLDVFVPSLNLAFEYNGLRHHSDLRRKPNYHLHKTRESLAAGIRLIHIFEDEWLKKRHVVENLVRVLVGKEVRKINARDCDFKEVSWTEYSTFLDCNHIQGSGTAPSFSFGLFNEEVLVAVMGFSSRDCDSGCVELTRFCSTGLVRGGFSKLLKRSLPILSDFEKVVSFSDTRWSRGDIYSSNGFLATKILRPDYWYVVRINREDKRSFQRKYLPNKLEIFDEALSERMNCAANGIYRIFDCGKVKWELPLR